MKLWDIRQVQTWLYNSSFFFIVILFLGFVCVLPIDSIAQASRSRNNALNTFIVVGAIVLFAIFAIVVIVGRMIYLKSCLKDIPRRYIPITPADLPHSSSRKMVHTNMNRSKVLTALFKNPGHPVIHDGLEPPSYCDEPSDEKILPEYLNYEDCIKIISDRFKYHGVLLTSTDLPIKLHHTLSDVVRTQYCEKTEDPEFKSKCKEFVNLYEDIKFSGNDITREQFLEFLELCIYMSDNTISVDDASRREYTIRKNEGNEAEYFDDDDDIDRYTTIYTENLSTSHEPDGESYDSSIYAGDEQSYYPDQLYTIRQNSTSTVARRVPSNAPTG